MLKNKFVIYGKLARFDVNGCRIKSRTPCVLRVGSHLTSRETTHQISQYRSVRKGIILRAKYHGMLEGEDFTR